jgi:hypothetical protein
MSVRAGGAEDMFLDIKDLAVRKQVIRKSYAPGSIDYQTAEMKQIDPLEVKCYRGAARRADSRRGRNRDEGRVSVRSMSGARCGRGSPIVRPLL